MSFRSGIWADTMRDHRCICNFTGVTCYDAFMFSRGSVRRKRSGYDDHKLLSLWSSVVKDIEKWKIIQDSTNSHVQLYSLFIVIHFDPITGSQCSSSSSPNPPHPQHLPPPRLPSELP
jgi:hypothetical protein